ncbi:hypothetical protein CRM86_20565 [Pseudomonas putida]|nr:hypothetical protein CRM86_20565 [Pseudomonas putida]
MAYSPKMDTDLIILGDLEIIHWATHLESSPIVQAYRFDEDVDINLDLTDVDDFSTIRGIWVENRDGSIELHQIDSSEKLEPDLKSIPIRYRLIDQGIRHGKLVTITYAHLALLAYQLDFWLKVVAMASQMRSYSLAHETELVGIQVQLMKEGNIRSLLDELPIKDPAIALGVICKLIISGSMQVQVGKHGFGYNTTWCAA